MEQLVRRRERYGLVWRSAHWLNSNPSWKAAILWAAACTGAARVCIGIVMAAAWMAARPYLLPILKANPEFYGKLPLYTGLPGEAVLGVWLRWDAVHHMNLALRGYFDVSPGDSVFYPLYAFLVRGLALPFRLDLVLSGLIVSTLASFTTLVFLYKIADRFYGSQAARWSVAALAVYPTAFFLLGPYTESLFLALTLAAFWFAYQNRWLLVGGLGFFASLSRGPGLYTSGALAWTAYQQLSQSEWSWKRLQFRRLLPILAGLSLPILGGIAFLAWKTWAGFPSLVEVMRTYTHWVVTDPLTSLSRALLACLHTPNLEVILEATSALAFLGLTLLLIINRRWRRPEWILYMALNMGVFLSRYSTYASPLQSIGRYVLVLFPAFILIGDWLSRRGKGIRLAYCIVSSTLLVLFSSLYVLGWFIG